MISPRVGLSASMFTLLSLLPTMAMAESLTEAVQMTVSSHPKVGVVANDRKAIDEELNQAKGLFLPQIDLRADNGFGYTKQRGSSTADDGDALNTMTGQVTLKQMLFDGYQSSSEVDRQENRIRSAAHRVRETSELVALDAIEAYLNVLRSRQLLEIADENLTAHRALQGDISKRERGGAGTRGDVDQADARVAQAEAVRIQLEGDLRDAEARYYSLTGQFPGDLTRPTVDMAFMPASLEQAVDVSLVENPTVDIRTSDVDVAAAELKQTKSTFYPSVNIEGSAGRSKNADGVRGIQDDVGAGLVLRWNLYRGGADVAREKEFQWRQAEAQSELETARRDVEEQMRRVWAARDAARARAEKYAQQVESNKGVLGAYKKQFNSGERTLLDVLDSQNEYFISTTNMISSYYTALFGDYQVLAQRGALLKSVGATLPASASLVSEEEQVKTGLVR